MTKHQVGNSTFGFAIGFYNTTTQSVIDNHLLDPTYFTLEIENIKYTLSSNGSTTFVADQISYASWNDTGTFQIDDHDYYERNRISSYLCPTNTDYYL